jgi:LacI family transcriptional regulator
MGNSNNVTIVQVAREAGVSIQTVSRVINNRYDVAANTRQRVQDAILRLGYQPNAFARGLASKRSRTLGLVTHDFNDHFFTQVVTGAEEEAHQRNYFCMLGSSNCSMDEMPKYLSLLTERHVEGVVLAREGGPDELEQINRIAMEGTPFVVVGFHRDGQVFSSVDINNFDGGRRATECLLQYGHQCIACITGPIRTQSAQDRLSGYKAALEQAMLCFDPSIVVEGSYGNSSFGSGYHGMKKLLETNPNITAVFVQNDRMGVGAISALQQAGLRVPDDISLIGYDDTPEAEFSSPPLTTVRQDTIKLGTLAVQILLRHIEDTNLAPEQVLLDTELVWRESVTWPRAVITRKGGSP